MLRSSQWEYAFVGSENQTFPLPILDNDEQSVFFSQSHPVPHDYTFHFLLSTDIMSDLKPESITKLASASTYPQWAADMSGYIRFAGSWKVVMSADTMPAPTEVAALQDWIAKDQRAVGIMYLRTDRSIHHFLDSSIASINEGLQARTLWTKLKDKYGSPDTAATWSKFEVMISDPKMSESKPLQDQINKIHSRVKEIVSNGIKLEENVQALLILSKLPESYRPTISALMATIELKDLTVDTIVTKTLSEESLRKTGNAANRISKPKTRKAGKDCGHCKSEGRSGKGHTDEQSDEGTVI